MTIGGNPVPVTFDNERELSTSSGPRSPGRRLQHRRDESGRPLGHAPQRLRLAVFGHRALEPLRQCRSPSWSRPASRPGRRRELLQGQNVTRQQMAVFVLKAKHGICYVPPPCSGDFPDVPCSSNFAPWIEQMAAEGITGGCGGGNFCPLNPVRRDQMAVFLLKGKYGSTFTPPPCTGEFDDVACPSRTPTGSRSSPRTRSPADAARPPTAP